MSTGQRRLQLGLESTAGTAVAATAVWRGEVNSIDDKRKIERPAENIGYIPKVNRTYTPFLLAGLDMPETPATFEQLPYILTAGVKAVATGAADGAGTSKIYAYPFSTTTPNTISTYTLEAISALQCEEMEYAFVEKFSLSGKYQEALKMSATWAGRQASVVTATGSLSLPAVEEILTQTGKLYIDAASGTLGSTQKSNTLLEFGFEVTTGYVPRFRPGGLAFGGIVLDRDAMALALSITFEHDATAVAERAAWRAETPRLIRLAFEGSAVGTSGTTYSKKTALIDLAGTWDKFEVLDQIQGNDVVKATFVPDYNPTAALFAAITVVNELTALT